jgi:hypothetical protein
MQNTMLARLLSPLSPRLIATLLLLHYTSYARGQDIPAEEIDFNFVYSTVLGTGFYSAGSERVLVVRIPISWSLAPMDEKNRLKLLFPVAVGVRDIVNNDGDFEFPDQLLTASFLPGIAWERYMRPQWMLIPSAQIGGAKDMQLDTSAWLTSLALRSFAWWDFGTHRLALGNRLLGASQKNVDSGNQTGFVLLESGLDWDFRLPLKLAGRPLSSSIYVLWQHYADDVNIDAVSGEEVSLANVYQLGTTFGFRKPVTLLGFIPIQRVGIAVGRGNTVSGGDLKSISLNLGFPLSYN